MDWFSLGQSIGNAFTGKGGGGPSLAWQWDAMLNERKHQSEQKKWDRRYAEQVTRRDRKYAEKKTREDRAYAEQQVAKDRAYAQQLLDADRAYMNRKYGEDLRRYQQDRNFMQDRANDLVDKSAESRGIDFTRMRDDAVKAGYNPMTALSMAHAYSTQKDYQIMGDVYSPRANYTAASGGAAGTPTGSSPSITQSSVPAGGGVGFNGSGFTGSGTPALSAGSFVTEALGRGLDTVFNRPDPQDDALTGALRNAMGLAEAQAAAEAQNYQKNFGYSLTKQQPFSATVSVGVPAMRSQQEVGLQPAASRTKEPSVTGEMEKGGRKFVPVQLPNGTFGSIEKTLARQFDVEPFDLLSAEQWEGIGGDNIVTDTELALNTNSIRRSAIDAPLIAPYVTDYFKYGTTGSKIMSQPGYGNGRW